jgi:hypothetical protein
VAFVLDIVLLVIPITTWSISITNRRRVRSRVYRIIFPWYWVLFLLFLVGSSSSSLLSHLFLIDGIVPMLQVVYSSAHKTTGKHCTGYTRLSDFVRTYYCGN